LRMLCKQERLYAYRFDGKRHDIGNRLDYMKSSVEFALRREDIGKEFREFILELAETLRKETGA
ncbi:MAG TPA: UTP--glucose-1-phosphate uridylyltransferase, partial [bacterium]|nr:UTP--glucose-1-phosphate uridylyltransferase [bacterium]